MPMKFSNRISSMNPPNQIGTILQQCIDLHSIVYMLLYFYCVRNMCPFHECGIINILM